MALNTRCEKCGTRLGAEDYLPSGELDCLLCKATRPSVHERLARAKKVTAIVAAIDRIAINKHIDPHGNAGQIQLASFAWGEEHWVALCKLARVRHEPAPSLTTRDAVRAVYVERAKGKPLERAS